MVGIFAIIAIIRQAKFAIIAMDFIAIIAKCSFMSSLDMKNKVWLAERLEQVPHGGLGAIAAEIGVSGTQLSRMANIDPEALPKNTQNIPLDKLLALAGHFKDLPPGIIEGLTRANISVIAEPVGSLEAEIADLLKQFPDHLKESFLTILRSWKPDEAKAESAAETGRPAAPKLK